VAVVLPVVRSSVPVGACRCYVYNSFFKLFLLPVFPLLICSVSEGHSLSTVFLRSFFEFLVSLFWPSPPEVPFYESGSPFDLFFDPYFAFFLFWSFQDVLLDRLGGVSRFLSRSPPLKRVCIGLLTALGPAPPPPLHPTSCLACDLFFPQLANLCSGLN